MLFDVLLFSLILLATAYLIWSGFDERLSKHGPYDPDSPENTPHTYWYYKWRRRAAFYGAAQCFSVFLICTLEGEFWIFTTAFFVGGLLTVIEIPIALIVHLMTLLWRLLLRPILFLLPAEKAHYWAMGLFSVSMKLPPMRWLLRKLCEVDDPVLKCERWRLPFVSPVGLAAGFDKNAKWFNELHLLGFGFIEVGTLTPQGQPGNEQPRLFRLKQDRALINRMGFNNQGAEATARGLAKRSIHPILGINVGKAKVTPNGEALQDYLKGLELLYPYGDYFTINISSPNTQGLRDLQAEEPLSQLLQAMVERNQKLATEHDCPSKPILVKIAPDLSNEELKQIAVLCLQHKIDGIIATNTTIAREPLTTDSETVNAIGAGGLSGLPLTQRSREVVSFLYQETHGQLPIVGAGGIMNADDAWEMLRAGASLIQVYTGFIYCGPMFVKQINKSIERRLKKAGHMSVDEVIGAAHREE